MSTTAEDARARALERIALRKQRIEETAIGAELEQQDAARPVLGTPVESATQIIKGALLGIAEWPQAFADAGVPDDPNDFHLINDSLRFVSRETKASINYWFPESESASGDLSEGVGRFLSTFIPVGRALKLNTAANWFTRTFAAGAAADFAAFEPAQENLNSLIQSFPALKNPVSEYLATDPNDAAADNRARNMVEGALIGLIGDGLVQTFVGGLRALRGVSHAASRLEAEKAGREAAKEITIPDAPSAPIVEAAADADPRLPILKDATPEQAAAVAGGTQSPAQTAIALRATGEEGLKDFNVNKIDWNTFGDKPDDIFNIIELTSRVYADQIDAAKGGVQAVERTRQMAVEENARLAQLTGGTVEGVNKLYKDVRGDAGIAARTHAAYDVMLASAQRVRALAQNVIDTGAGRAKLLIAVEQHAAIQAQVKGATTEIARALRQMRELKQATEVDLDLLARADDKLVKKLAGEHRLDDLNKAVRRASGNRFSDYALELWINGLLSNPVTHVVNFTSNSIKAGLSIPERTIAAGIGKIRQLAGQDVERIRLQETTALAHGIIQGAVDAFKLPLRSLGRAARETLKWDLAAAKKIITDDEAQYGNVYRAIVRGHGVVDATTKLEVRGAAFRWDTSQTQGALKRGLQAMNLVGSAIRAPGAALQASDELFKSLAYRQQLHALAMRTALGEADKLPRYAREAFVKKRIAELLKDPPEEMQMASIGFAQQQTFTNKLGPRGQWVQQGLARFPEGRLLVPFIRTPTNILKDFFSYTPGPLFNLVRRDFQRQLMQGGPAADLAIARMFMGTAAMAAVWQLADAGLIRGGGPTGRDSSEITGEGTYGIKFGDTWYSFNRLEPLGMLLGMTADIHDTMQRNYEIDGDNTNLIEALQIGALSAAKNAASKTWLTGIADAVEAASDWDRYGEGYMDRLAVSFVPYSSGMRWAAGLEDPYAREAFDLLDKVRAVVPGNGASLPVRRDYLGRPVKHNRSWLSPIAVSHESTDPVDKELARLEFEFQMPAKSIDGVPLSAQQYSRMLELRGTLGGEEGNLHATLMKLINSPEYAAMSDSPDPSILRNSKAAEIKRVVGKFGRAAVNALKAEDATLRDQWVQRRLHQLAQ